MLLAANLGEDADTTAAITGQLAGALSMVPPAFLSDGMTGWRGSLGLAVGRQRFTNVDQMTKPMRRLSVAALVR